MSSDDVVEQLNAHQPAVIKTFKGRVLAIAPERKELRMEFEIGPEHCHTVDIVQGGVITAMLDASMAPVGCLDSTGDPRSTAWST